MAKLSTPQIKALANAGSVGYAGMIDFRPNTITALITRGLIEKTIEGYRITSVGVARLRAEMPDASIADCHLTLDDVLSETDDTDSTAFLPEHLTHGLNGQKVQGAFFNSDREFNFRGIVKGEYLSAKIHGFRIPMVSVLTDGGQSIFVPFGNVKLDNWHPTFVQGTDDNDPVLEVLGTELINGETVLWVSGPGGEFYLGENEWLIQRYWRAFPIQVVPTKWRAERNGLNLWRDEDMAMAHDSTPVFPTRFGAVGALINKLTDDIQLCKKHNYDFSHEASILKEIIAHPEHNAWSVGNVQWSIRGW
jgi:hypothetical protein